MLHLAGTGTPDKVTIMLRGLSSRSDWQPAVSTLLRRRRDESVHRAIVRRKILQPNHQPPLLRAEPVAINQKFQKKPVRSRIFFHRC